MTRPPPMPGGPSTGSRHADLAPLAARLGHEFDRPELLHEALVHASVDRRARGGARHGFERLEFLGDRVLGLIVAEWLYEQFPDEAEGELSRRHAALVRRESLTAIALAIDLPAELRLSRAEAATGGRQNEAILADACEAVIGALYLDGGYGAARDFLRRHLAGALERQGEVPQDPKTGLQEWAQGRGLPLPRYRTVGRTGPDHDPVFTIEVTVEGHAPAQAEAQSKQAASKAAAAALLSRLTGEPVDE